MINSVWKINPALPFLIEYVRNQNYTGTQYAPAYHTVRNVHGTQLSTT